MNSGDLRIAIMLWQLIRSPGMRTSIDAPQLSIQCCTFMHSIHCSVPVRNALIVCDELHLTITHLQLNNLQA